ncbi:MAG: NAD-glutamate dehydrogenase [Anaeromyxobacter sp.]|nr:NAD-glutamate dehydrogenase [Anaeromyxobacter sp.]
MTAPQTSRLDRDVQRSITTLAAAAKEGYRWLSESVPDLLASPLREEEELLARLAAALPRLATDREVTVVDREHELVLARLDRPGSVFETLKQIEDRDIAASEIFHSDAPVPGLSQALEVHRYEFARPALPGAPPPEPLAREARRAIHAAAAASHPDLKPAALDEALGLLLADNQHYVRLAPARDVAQLAWILHQCQARGGFLLDLVEAPAAGGGVETTVLFGVASPPPRGFLMQLTEVMNALNLGMRRSLALSAVAGGQRYFVASFRVAHREGVPLTRDSELFRSLRRQIFATQILSVEAPTYRDFVLPRLMTCEDAGLVNAFIGFSHTNCAHNQIERYTFEDVVRAFHFHPEMSLQLVKLFKTRFDPDLPDREAAYARALAEAEHEVAAHNTGHRMLDDFRRSLFRVALIFVRRTLKTNFFVDEKQALAFRLDPAYLDDLGPEFTADLPPERPFRVTFFMGRYGLGYHIGFADIARGGWRTIFSHNRDDYVTVANRLFRENYVLAHTQHLKNKDIYEGGSKLVVVVHVPGPRRTPAAQSQLLYKVQRGFINAFLDVFVTEGGKARDPRVVDYYGEDEPIELGPDENMHDAMIEEIAQLSVRRGYILGGGIMSSKHVGINHKEYGVTSTGVVAFCEIAMKERGVDLRRDPFSVKFTGGPNGDVAGNAMRLLLERCPGVAITLIVDGTGALMDPRGLDREALSQVVLKADAEAFDPSRLSPGGFVLYRNQKKTDGLRELHRRVEMTAAGLRWDWVTIDDFHQEFDTLLFRVEADLFIPAGGRPETIDQGNWRQYLKADGTPSAPVIVEGANSFITPEARVRLQEAGVVLLRDASANKCGVISSSYEIIGNLLLDEQEFMAHKPEYVRDVLEILERRATDEASLLFRRHREEGGRRRFTELSEALSVEINQHKARLFRWFEAHPEETLRPPYRQALLAHLPRLIRENPSFKLRIKQLPPKYRSAILAAELATTMVYRRPLEPDYGAALHAYTQQMFP